MEGVWAESNLFHVCSSSRLWTLLRLQLRGGAGRQPLAGPVQDPGWPPGGGAGPEPEPAGQRQVELQGETAPRAARKGRCRTKRLSRGVYRCLFQMTGRYAEYAEELAKAVRHDFKPNVVKE